MRTSKTIARESRWHSAAYDAALFIALLATAIALGGALAHAFEFPNKIGLEGDEYFVVQKAYRGWNQIAYVLLVQVIAMSAVAVLSRREPIVRRLAIIAMLCLVCAQAAFWIYTYPANAATHNWTTMPGNWEELRRQWEYSHLAGAVFQLVAMIALIVAALARGRRPLPLEDARNTWRSDRRSDEGR